TQPADLQASVSAIYVHDFAADLAEIHDRLRRARAGANAAGVPSSVPIRITEYNLALRVLVERHNDSMSWWRTQENPFTNEWAAAFAVHYLSEALDEENVDMACFAALGTNLLFWGEQAVVS